MFKKQALAAIAAGSAMALSLIAVAPAAHAALTQSQVNAVIGLLQSFGVDQGTITNVQGVLSGASTTPVAGSVGGQVGQMPSPPGQGVGLPCAPGLNMNLRMGSRGEDVMRLQQFLAKDPTVFDGQATGFFGSKTEDAVRHWQLDHGIIATDTPSSAGAGRVGPATRGMLIREMERECHRGDGNQGGNGSTTPQGDR